jgi:5-methylcytosine-specific restriction endonuclease McrA
VFRRWIGGLPATRVLATDEGTTRRIPAATTDAVFARDKGRCTFIGSNGERCASTYHLQIDHVIPFARGGTNAPGNLRLLCERHNKKEAERVLGPNVKVRFRARE